MAPPTRAGSRPNFALRPGREHDADRRDGPSRRGLGLDSASTRRQSRGGALLAATATEWQSLSAPQAATEAQTRPYRHLAGLLLDGRELRTGNTRPRGNSNRGPPTAPIAAQALRQQNPAWTTTTSPQSKWLTVLPEIASPLNQMIPPSWREWWWRSAPTARGLSLEERSRMSVRVTEWHSWRRAAPQPR